MTAVNSSHLVLLDLENAHETFENIYISQIFSRFTNKNLCLQHISSHTNTRLVHFFIPKTEHVLIGADIIFLKTIFYIYCMNQADVDEMQQQYKFPMFVKIFNTESLSTYLHHAAIGLLIEQAERKKHEPDEYDVALQAAVEHSLALAKELEDHMIVKTGTQPEDRR